MFMDNEFYVATMCVIYFPLSNMYICWGQGVYRMLIVNIELIVSYMEVHGLSRDIDIHSHSVY